jgi:hypothetical protein
MKLLKFIFTLILMWLFVFEATAQKKQQQAITTPYATFLADTVRIGEPVRFLVVWKHLPEKEVFFPDSTHDFKPFEFVSKRAFPTKTAGLSTDSVIYTLATFETDSLQSLALPIFVLNQRDTTTIVSNADEIFVQATVLQLPDTLKIMENTELRILDDNFNYWYWAGGAVVFIGVGIGLYAVFGRRIRKNFRLTRMRKQYQRFIADFDKSLKKYEQVTATEQGLSVWKGYLENLQNIPFTTYTSKEIADLVPDKTLTESLKNIDRAVYGNRINEQTKEALEILKIYAQNTYQAKIKEVQNQ